MKLIRHKRGATFRVRRPLPMDPTGWTITAQMRAGNIVQDIDVRALDPEDFGGQPGDKGVAELTVAAELTAIWPLSLLQFDVRAQRAGEVVFSQTFTILVEPEITQP